MDLDYKITIDKSQKLYKDILNLVNANKFNINGIEFCINMVNLGKNGLELSIRVVKIDIDILKLIIPEPEVKHMINY